MLPNKEKSSLKVGNLPKETTDNNNDSIVAELGQESKNRVIFLIGSTGKGKSTLANVITGLENKFKESEKSTSGTREIQKEEFTDKDSNISYAVIDTVGMGDTKLKKEEVL